MNIYKISQDINRNYGTYTAAVVVAPDADMASRMHPGGPDVYTDCAEASASYWDMWTTPENVTVELVGYDASGPARVILAEYIDG